VATRQDAGTPVPTSRAASRHVLSAPFRIDVFTIDAEGFRRFIGKTTEGPVSVPDGRWGVLARRGSAPVDSIIEALRGTGVCALEFDLDCEGDLAGLCELRGLERLTLGLRLRDGAELARLAALPNLRYLELRIDGLEDRDYAHLRGLRMLEHLELYGGRIGDAALREVVALPRLAELCIWRSNLTVSGMAQLRVARLRELELGGYGLDPATLAGLAGHPTLERLAIYHEGSFDAATLAHLRQLPALRELTFEYCGRFTDEAVAQIAAIDGLRVLRFIDGRISNIGLRHLSRLPLEELRLDGAETTDSGLVYLGRMTTLRRLALWDMRISDGGLGALRELSRLESLFMTNTTVTAAGLVRLPPGLRSLTVHGAAARGFDFSRFPRLEKLNLDQADVDDATLASIGRLRGLTYLDLDETGVTSAGLARLAGLADLRTLSLKYTRVDDTGLAHLAKLASLEEVDLRGTKVTRPWRPTSSPRRP
jgi:hypothetical protein